MSQWDRKYDGPPQQELRSTSVDKLPKGFHGKKRRKKNPQRVDFYHITTIIRKERGDTRPKWHYWRDNEEPIPFFVLEDEYPPVEIYSFQLTDYVYKAKKWLMYYAPDTGLYWLEDQRKNVTSPEFSSAYNLHLWVVYSAMEDGFLVINPREYPKYWDRDTGEWVVYDPPKIRYFLEKPKQDFKKLQ